MNHFVRKPVSKYSLQISRDEYSLHFFFFKVVFIYFLFNSYKLTSISGTFTRRSVTQVYCSFGLFVLVSSHCPFESPAGHLLYT